jgi:calcineurin-like phosphoesterase family protein
MERKPIFFTSDLHIGHANSIIFDSRPFKDVEHMHTVLVNNFNATIPPDGLCYFLGDIGLAKNDDIKNVLSRMNFRKLLILGNHDGGHNAMYKAGFDVVLNSASLEIAGEVVTMSHHPLPGIKREETAGMRGSVPGENYHGEARDNAKFYSVPNRGQFHLHGHCHANPKNPKNGSVPILDRQFDVGVCAHGFRPVSISKIESWIAITRKMEASK